LGARATVGGLVEIYRNGGLIGRVDLSAGSEPWSYSGQPGRIGVWFEADSFEAGAPGFTDFGGGTLP
jgi:hypothetical protein